MTTKDAVLALAAKIAGTTQGNVSTTAQALNKLAYAVTGETPTTDLMTVDDCIAFITANYTPGGGGGETAKLTVTYTDEPGAMIYVACAGAGSSEFRIITAGDHDVFLVDGKALAFLVEYNATVTTSGSITDNGDGTYLITGDAAMSIDWGGPY